MDFTLLGCVKVSVRCFRTIIFWKLLPMGLLSWELKKWNFFLFSILSAPTVFYTYVFLGGFLLLQFLRSVNLQNQLKFHGMTHIHWTREGSGCRGSETKPIGNSALKLSNHREQNVKIFCSCFSCAPMEIWSAWEVCRRLQGTYLSFNLFLQDWCKPLSVCFEILTDNHLSH